MVGTLYMSLSLRDCSLLILFFGLLCTVFPAYFSTFGARTGMRQMIHARFTFGYGMIQSSFSCLTHEYCIIETSFVDTTSSPSLLSAIFALLLALASSTAFWAASLSQPSPLAVSTARQASSSSPSSAWSFHLGDTGFSISMSDTRGPLP